MGEVTTEHDVAPRGANSFLMHPTHPFIFELAARILTGGNERDSALWLCREHAVPLVLVYRAIHVIENVRKDGGTVLDEVFRRYLLDGQMSGYALIDGRDADFATLREAAFEFYGVAL